MLEVRWHRHRSRWVVEFNCRPFGKGMSLILQRVCRMCCSLSYDGVLTIWGYRRLWIDQFSYDWRRILDCSNRQLTIWKNSRGWWPNLFLSYKKGWKIQEDSLEIKCSMIFWSRNSHWPLKCLPTTKIAITPASQSYMLNMIKNMDMKTTAP